MLRSRGQALCSLCHNVLYAFLLRLFKVRPKCVCLRPQGGVQETHAPSLCKARWRTCHSYWMPKAVTRHFTGGGCHLHIGKRSLLRRRPFFAFASKPPLATVRLATGLWPHLLAGRGGGGAVAIGNRHEEARLDSSLAGPLCVRGASA